MTWAVAIVGGWCLFWSVWLLSTFGLTYQVLELFVASTAVTMAGLREAGL